MARIPLIWRMVAPTLIVSLILLLVGLGAAWYVFRWNQRISSELDRQISQVVAAQSLVMSIRDLRVALGRSATLEDGQLFALAAKSAGRAEQQIRELQSLCETDVDGAIRSLEQKCVQLTRRVDELDPLDRDAIDSLRKKISDSTLPEAQALLEKSRADAAHVSQQNRLVAGRVGLSLAVLGLCGAVAGLLAGFGIARSVTRSIEQLEGSVSQVANTLSFGNDSSLRPDGLPGLIAAMGEVHDQTASVVDELELARATAIRQDQLAAVGQLAAGIAHELRNPLAAVKLLVDSTKERGEALQGEDLDVIQEEISRIDVMLRSFLDFARPPKVRKEMAELSEAVSSAVELVRPRAARLGVHFERDDFPPVELLIDREQIRQVIVNLLSNAVEAQPHGGRVRITQSLSTDPQTPCCSIDVSDEGPGVPSPIVNSIFQPFISSKETGIGLGLAICRRIAESHGGTVELASNGGKGALFRLSLPLPDSSDNRGNQPCQSPSSS